MQIAHSLLKYRCDHKPSHALRILQSQSQMTFAATSEPNAPGTFDLQTFHGNVFNRQLNRLVNQMLSVSRLTPLSLTIKGARFSWR